MPLVPSTHLCRISDWPALATICRSTLSEVSNGMMSYALRNYLEDTIVLESGGEVVGYWMANRHHGEGVAWLEQIAVDPRAQGKGYGRFLLRDFERRMADAGFRELQLSAHEYSSAAIALYEREGWIRLAHPGEKRGYAKALPGTNRPLPPPLKHSLPRKLWRHLAYRWLVR
ncbi:MAG: GNAT family N-acetyltransferase [Bdellovibrionales bacterium]|nr:GNAT family N-acetyltransferase [Bdellovibrionales bacterium]